MPIKFQLLLLQDVQIIFDSIGSNSPEDILTKLKDMGGKIFDPFAPHRRQGGLWITEMWATGPQYDYKGFPDPGPDFPSADNPQVNPLPIKLSSADRLQGAFRYLFPSRNGHWNCSNRSGGYYGFISGPDITEINKNSWKFPE